MDYRGHVYTSKASYEDQTTCVTNICSSRVTWRNVNTPSSIQRTKLLRQRFASKYFITVVDWRLNANSNGHDIHPIKTQRRWSHKIYKTKLTKTRYNNQVLGKYRVDPQRAGLTLIAELTWSNLGLKGALNKGKKDVRYGNDINKVNKKF